MAVTLILDMCDELAGPLGPIGAPPFRVTLQIRLGDRVDWLLAEVADEVAANHGGLALALVRSTFAAFHLTQDLRDVGLSHALEGVRLSRETLLGPVGGLVPDGV